MKVGIGTKVWIIINSLLFSIDLMFFILGLLRNKTWINLWDFYDILKPLLVLRLLFHWVIIVWFVLIITLIIFIYHLWRHKTEQEPLPTIWFVGEIFILSVGILEFLPVGREAIGGLYYMIPGW